MKKQFQSRQYGYVSPKCKFAQVPTGLAFCASPLYDGTNHTEKINIDTDEDL